MFKWQHRHATLHTRLYFWSVVCHHFVPKGWVCPYTLCTSNDSFGNIAFWACNIMHIYDAAYVASVSSVRKVTGRQMSALTDMSDRNLDETLRSEMEMRPRHLVCFQSEKRPRLRPSKIFWRPRPLCSRQKLHPRSKNKEEQHELAVEFRIQTNQILCSIHTA